MLKLGRFLLLCVFCVPLLLAAFGCEEKREVNQERVIEKKHAPDFVVQ